MPPATTTRGSGLSRSEAAILAWKKRTRAAPKVTGGMANPKIRARVAEILAEKANKGKKKAKAKAKPKGKGSADAAKKKAEAAAKKAERVKAAAAKKQEREKAKLAAGMQRTATQAARTAAQQAKQAERAKIVAEKKKQAEGKQKVMARARKKSKAKKEPKADDTAERASAALEKWRKIREIQRIGKAIDMEIKAGARHSRTDMEHLQGIHDSSVACGASCGPESDDTGDADTETAEKAIKGIMDNPQWYASHECGDVMQAASALQTLCMLIQSELAEEDEDAADVTQLVDAARTLVTFIGGELDELEGAAGDAANDARMGPMNKAVTEDAAIHIDGSAVKALDGDAIRGYAVLFGDADKPDLERDFYTKSTDFWLDHWGWPKPITYHHGMDPATRNDPVVGHWLKAGVDDVGVWMEGQIDKAHAYYKAMKELAARGYLRLSSDSAPQWVIRERQQNGANYIKRWPLVTSSVTVTPMEPRMLPVEVKAFLAEIGYEAIESDSQEAIDPDAVEADGRQAADDERARRLSMELDLIELETIT